MKIRCHLRFASALVAAVAVAVFVWPGGPSSPAVRAAVPPTNILLIILDDVRWDSIGASGNRAVRTPRIDQLAAEGVRFERAYVTTSICMVSRASLLTGQTMSRHGIREFGRALAPEALTKTYPAVLRQAGYWAGYVGKYHVGTPRPEDYDFVRAYHGTHWIEEPDGRRVHVTEKNARDALEFLRARPKDRPFVLALGFFAPHAEDGAREQYLPQDWSAKYYERAVIPPPLHGAPEFLAALPPFLSSEANEGRRRYHLRFDTAESYQACMTRYYRLISEDDEAIGRVLDELKAERVYEQTLVVVIGDNGYFQADRGLADKWYPYEESIRVPLVIRDPRLPAARRGAVPQELALNIDIAPTLLAAAGVAIPSVMQGQDLSPLYLNARPPRWRDEFFYEHPTIRSKTFIPASEAVVRRDWKYIEWPEYGVSQLFDLVRDPDERKDLSASPADAAKLGEARRALAEWRERAR